MTITIKSGPVAEFFSSVKETAREIDQGRPITPKQTVWMEADDLAVLLQPKRTALLRYLREQEEIGLGDLAAALHRSEQSLKRDLSLLIKYGLVQLSRRRVPQEAVVRPVFAHQHLEFMARI